jgi:tetratricopeptide (TPR) repeat protein
MARRVLKADGEHRDARLVLANALLDQGRIADALKEALAILQTYPDSAEAWFLAGFAQAQSGQRASAERSLTEALRLDADLVDAHRVLGELLLLRGQRAEARTHLDHAITLAPDDPRAHLVIGRWFIYNGGNGDLISARRHVERVVRMASPPLDAYLLMGQIARGEEEWDEAIRYLKRATRVAPHDARVFFQLYQAYRGAGRDAEADRAFQAYLRLGKRQRAGTQGR